MHEVQRSIDASYSAIHVHVVSIVCCMFDLEVVVTSTGSVPGFRSTGMMRCEEYYAVDEDLPRDAQKAKLTKGKKAMIASSGRVANRATKGKSKKGGKKPAGSKRK